MDGNYTALEIKPCRFGSRIRDVEAFWYNRNQNHLLCASYLIVLIVSDCIVYPDPKFLISRVRVNHTIRHNQTQWHKVNDLDFCFVSKCLHILNSRTKPAGLDFLYYNFRPCISTTIAFSQIFHRNSISLLIKVFRTN